MCFVAPDSSDGVAPYFLIRSPGPQCFAKSSPVTAACPGLEDFKKARARLGDRVLTTPVWHWRGEEVLSRLPSGTELHLKLELLQKTGTFKPRGALLNMLAATPQQLDRGVAAVSAGNHAIAVSYAARCLRTSATVVMPNNADRLRVAACTAFGAKVLLVADVHAAFAELERIEQQEGRVSIPPFEGRETILGTGTVALELTQQCSAMDAVVVAVGGGGLCAGVATVIKQAWPSCLVFGVEPTGADTMRRSFAAGKPVAIERVSTIADSLGAPHAAPYSFELCRAHVDELVLVDDDELRAAMALMFRDAKLAVEPAGAAVIAAVLGPLRERLAGRRVVAIICGANIDPDTYAKHLLSTPNPSWTPT